MINYDCLVTHSSNRPNTPVVVTVALLDEIQPGLLESQLQTLKRQFFITVPLVITGIGNQPQVLTKLVEDYHPEMIINVGTAVARRKSDLLKVFYFNKFTNFTSQIVARAFTEYVSPDSILTVNQFVTSSLQLGQYHFADMEAFHQADFCRERGIGFLSIKVISDVADSTSPDRWKSSLKIVSPKIRAILQHLSVIDNELDRQDNIAPSFK